MSKVLLVILSMSLWACVYRPADDCSYVAEGCREEYAQSAYSRPVRSYPTTSSSYTASTFLQGRLMRVVSGSEVLLDISDELVLGHLEAVQDSLANEQLLQQWVGRVFEVRILTQLNSTEWVVYLYDDSGGQVNYLLE